MLKYLVRSFQRLTMITASRAVMQFLIPVVAFLPFQTCASAAAQEQRGTVKADSLQVYSQMSADSEQLTTLPRGTSIRIALSITNGEGSWCSVSNVDTSEKLGYVRCNGLERQNAPSTAVSGGGALSMSSAISHPPTREQKAWAIAASAILASFNHEPLNTLPSSGNAPATRKLLRD